MSHIGTCIPAFKPSEAGECREAWAGIACILLTPAKVVRKPPVHHMVRVVITSLPIGNASQLLHLRAFQALCCLL